MFSGVSLLSVLSLLGISYLIGSIPSTLIASRLSSNVDLRNFGSGSAGGTNAIRVLGPVRGLLAGIADVAKGLLCASIIPHLWFDSGPDTVTWQVASGVFAVLGHIWPVWAGFRGGKGVATTIGVLIAIDLPAAVAFCALGLTATVISRYVSVGSLTASVLLPIVLGVEATFLSRDIASALIVFGTVLPLLIVYTHRSNIRRLSTGTELRVGYRVKRDVPTA